MSDAVDREWLLGRVIAGAVSRFRAPARVALREGRTSHGVREIPPMKREQINTVEYRIPFFQVLSISHQTFNLTQLQLQLAESDA